MRRRVTTDVYLRSEVNRNEREDPAAVFTSLLKRDAGHMVNPAGLQTLKVPHIVQHCRRNDRITAAGHKHKQV